MMKKMLYLTGLTAICAGFCTTVNATPHVTCCDRNYYRDSPRYYGNSYGCYRNYCNCYKVDYRPYVVKPRVITEDACDKSKCYYFDPNRKGYYITPKVYMPRTRCWENKNWANTSNSNG